MTRHHHRVLICAALLIFAAAPALAQKPGISTLYTFPTGSSATTGYHPWGGLAMDSSGALYGTTYYGGNCQNFYPNCGSIYALLPPAAGQTAWSYQTLHLFQPLVPTQGYNEDLTQPISPLTYYQGALYGTGSAAGDTNCGCGGVFSIVPGTYTIMHVFDPFVPGAMDINQWPNGTTPIGGLLINNGTIYGTTSSGGNGGALGPDHTNGAGIVYSIGTNGSGFTVLHNFDGSLNTGPQGMIIFGQDGAIYGTQYGGGTYNQGVIWRMTTGGAYSVLYNFLGTNQPGGSSDGANPEGRLALGPDGTIFGTTTFGGDATGHGTAWSIKQVGANWVYTQLYKFGSNSAGSFPHSGLILAVDGALYGTTSGGGQDGGGTFYKLLQNGGTWTYYTLHNFVPLDVNGDTPYGDLLYINNNFYGVNMSGGAVSQCASKGCGTVFQLNLRSGTHNFNGDGFSDLVWRNTGGVMAMWLMNGATVSTSAAIATMPSTWSLVGQRDFNGDGYYDWLWRDTSGNTAIWFMKGTTLLSSGTVGNIATTWSVVGTGDFNGDGLGDILWEDTSGHLSVWLMNGATPLATAGIGTLPPATWKVVGIGDFNGDGRSDILWSDTSGNLSIWFMNGTQLLLAAGVTTVPTSWSVAGVGDFNGDGHADIVWRDTSGNVSIWLMANYTVLASAGLGNVPLSWSIVQTGDYNGDGKSDLVWHDTSGNVAIWYMNGTALSAVQTVGVIPTTWTVQTLNSD